MGYPCLHSGHLRSRQPAASLLLPQNRTGRGSGKRQSDKRRTKKDKRFSVMIHNSDLCSMVSFLLPGYNKKYLRQESHIRLSPSLRYERCRRQERPKVRAERSAARRVADTKRLTSLQDNGRSSSSPSSPPSS